MPSPLHHSAWLRQLQASAWPSCTLFAALMQHCGAVLTCEWLDRTQQASGALHQTGLPGLYTEHDVQLFWKNHELLVEDMLRTIPTVPGSVETYFYTSTCLDHRRGPRRTRVALFFAIGQTMRLHPAVFEEARAWERRQHTPPAPFLS
jgi:hypothetical protein